MPRKNIKSALKNSVDAETQSLQGKESNITVQKKFENAESVLEQPNTKDVEEKPKKVVRDSFTFPEEDINLIGELKGRYLKQAINATKSEIVRAGLHALSQMDDKELVEILQQLEKVKTGRPAK